MVYALGKLDLFTVVFASSDADLRALGFTLEKFAAMQEHGLKVYITGTWVSVTRLVRGHL